MVYILPRTWMPIPDLTVIEHRMMAIFVMAALFWLLEPIPIFATSVLVVFLELIMVSDKSFILFQPSSPNSGFGTSLHYADIMATFASPVIMLFLGGFFLAMAATKYQLDLNLTRWVLKPFGNRLLTLMLGIMLVTALFSMFMSNTATTAMMFAMLAPILKNMPEDKRGRTALALSVPFAANIGGIGTPIGTPPNAIALKYLSGPYHIGFGTWMSFAVPFVLILLLISWFLISRFFPPETYRIKMDYQGGFRKNRKAVLVYITFIATILLWMLDFLHGMNAYVVAFLPVAVFTSTRIITAQDLKRVQWDILWLMAGGLALGLGLEKSGLARHIVQAVPFSGISPLTVIFLATAVTLLMANFMSNTATANLLLPIFAALAVSFPSLSGMGGERMLLLGAAFSASLGMSLAISTPPNAIAYGSGEIRTPDMLKTGAVLGIIGLGMTYVMLFILNRIGFL